MKISKFFSVAVLATAVLFSSCNKDDDMNTENLQSEDGFFYGENGASVLTKADDAQVNKTYKTIIAKKDNNTVVEIVLNDLKIGTYDLSAKYAFTYVKAGSHWEASAGTLTITKNENNKLSGSFEATAGSGVLGVNSVEGKFKDIPIQ